MAKKVYGDVVYTPDYLVDKILGHLNYSGTVLEPCMGEGAFYNKLKGEKDWCEVSKGRDFFEYEGHVDWIITNPPWSIFRPFLKKSMEVADNVAFLVTMPHWTTKARLRDIQEAGFYIREFILLDSPDCFPKTGFQLVVGVISKTPGDTKWTKL